MASLDPLPHVRSLLEVGKIEDAADILFQAVRANNPYAIYELALWSIAGSIIPRNLTMAYNLLGQAKEIGHQEAALIYVYFTAAGTGCSPDWAEAYEVLEQLAKISAVAERQIELLERMELNGDGEPSKPFDVDRCSSQPMVTCCRQLLTVAECDHIIDMGKPYLAPSHVVDPQSGRMVPHPVRKSHGAMFGVYNEDMVINAVNRRVAAVSATEYEQGEPLQLLYYERGDEYRPHLDALPGEKNQRIMTVIIYLSDSYEGGQTHFLRTNFSFKGRKGDALIFANVLSDGRPDPLSIHCGKPVLSGTKLIASRWIRQARFTYPDPPSILKHIPGFAA